MDMRTYIVNEIQRFYDENNRVPELIDMKIYNGYPSAYEVVNEFGSWNNAVEASGFKPRFKRHTGDEVCCICGATETRQWYNSDNGKICTSCYKLQRADYTKGLLDIDSAAGFGFLGQRIVANKLGLELKYDCNCSVKWNHPNFDLFDSKRYGRIDVKATTLTYNSSSLRWYFNLGDGFECDNYIMLGFSKSRKDIIKVWIIPSNNNILEHKKSLSVYLNPKRIGKTARVVIEHEGYVKTYNDTFHSMSLKGCPILKKYT